MRFLLVILLAITANISAYAQANDQLIPIIQFGDFKGYGVRNATVDQILEHPYIKCLEKKCKVTSFDVYGITPGKEYIGPYRSEGGDMNDAQQRYIRSLVSDGKLWINNIHVQYTNGTEKIVGGKGYEYAIYFFNIQ